MEGREQGESSDRGHVICGRVLLELQIGPPHKGDDILHQPLEVELWLWCPGQLHLLSDLSDLAEEAIKVIAVVLPRSLIGLLYHTLQCQSHVNEF